MNAEAQRRRGAEEVDRLNAISGAEAQVLTYLRISSHRLGLLLNFGAPRLVDGLLRIVNGF